MRYIVILVWGTLPQSPTTFRLVFHSPKTRIYQLDGSAAYFARRVSGDLGRPRQRLDHLPAAHHARSARDLVPGLERRDRRPPNRHYSADGLFQAVTVSAGSHHSTFSFVPAAMNGALPGLLAGVALMLVTTARSASSFRARR